MEGQIETKGDRDVGPPVTRDDDESSEVPTILEEKMERTLVRKIDMNILPVVVLLYLFSFLDRGEWRHSDSPFCLRLSPGTMTLTKISSEYRKCSFIWSRRGPGLGWRSVPNRGFDPLCYLLRMQYSLLSLDAVC